MLIEKCKSIFEIIEFYFNFILKKQSQHYACADLYISLGNACRTAYWLNAHNLRVCSSPLDWMMCYSLETAVSLFKARFTTFFENRIYDNVNYTSKGMNVAKDLDTGMVALHHFEQGTTDAVAYPIFLEKMKKKFLKLDSLIKKSKTIAFVCNRNEDLKNFECFLFEMHKMYPNQKITLINIYNTTEYERVETLYFNSKVKFMQISFDDRHVDGDSSENPLYWIGNEKKWCEICSKFIISYRFIRGNASKCAK